MTPFFIIGNPRSGTTLLRLMLASHPDLLVTPECGFALWLAGEFSNQDCTSKSVRKAYAQQVCNCRKFDTWGITAEALESHLLKSTAGNYAELAAEVYHCYGKLIAKKKYLRWGDKNNFYLNQIDQIASLYPKAQFIHIIRDGRDVACSYKELHKKNITSRFTPGLPIKTEDIAREWRQNILTIQTGLGKLSPHLVLEQKFDSLLNNPSRDLSLICDFLGIKYDDQMLNYYLLNKQNQLEPRELLPWKEKTLQRPQRDRSGRYHQDLTKSQIQRFEKIAGDILSHYHFL
ncbi:sulfotransferase family protein [Pontiella agarivorans]|uniref:Sulfotransferase n=1 Tax=Pontiella agarivorans TaxID=3038953 RepID=A0ABU5N0D5_9BACT|nr:sulfotransferase [Pontiella agarivorans]MDZ8119821.1 sulfotransferase [Pontiella agarivorans]